MASAFTGWLGKSPFPPSDTRQWWLSRSQGREQPKESHSEQLPCKAKELRCLFSFVRAVTYILLQTPQCFHAVPPAWSRHGSSRDLGTPCRPRHVTACRRLEPCLVPDIQTQAGAQKCSQHLCLHCVGGPTPQRWLLLDRRNSPFPLPNFSFPP